MKKILLIPVIAVSLLTGCNNKPSYRLIDINEWFNHYDETARGTVNITSNPIADRFEHDYDLYVANLIKENVKDATIKKQNAGAFDLDYVMTYTLSFKYEVFKDVILFIFKDTIATATSAYDDNDYEIEQRVIYSVPEENIKAIVDGAKERGQYVKEEINREIIASKESASIDSLIKKADEAETKPTITRNVYYGLVDDKENWMTYPLNYSIMEDIKGLEFKEKSAYYYNSYQTPSIIVTMNEHYILRLFNWAEGCVADIEYQTADMYPVHFIGNYTCHIGYSINNEKMQALVDKTEPRG